MKKATGVHSNRFGSKDSTTLKVCQSEVDNENYWSAVIDEANEGPKGYNNDE